MPTERVRFDGSAGDRLAGILEIPGDGLPRATALFAHCFTCGKDLKAAFHISRALAQEGLAVLRFDFTGIGQSQGRFSETSVSSNVADLVAANRFLETHHGPAELLVGHSLGGTAVLLAARRLPQARAVALIGAPAEPTHLKRHLKEAGGAADRSGEPTVHLAGRELRLSEGFMADLAEHDTAAALGQLTRALLVLHAPLDDVVGIDNAARIFQAARHPKSFVSLDRADHLLSDPAAARYAGALIAAWAQPYLSGEPAGAPASESAPNAVVTRIGAEGFRTEVVAGGHRLIADEPLAVGGTDHGPTPYDYLLAGLGACTAMTLRMYADRKRWPLEAVEVALTHRKGHRRDCRDCPEDHGASTTLDEIDRVLELTGPLDAAQHRRLLEIADRCPVHRTLEGPLRIRTRLAGDADAPEG